MKKFTKELGPGWITLVENDDYALCRLIFGDGLEVDADEEETPLLKKGFQQIQEYWTGHRVIFTLPLAPGGSAFERADAEHRGLRPNQSPAETRKEAPTADASFLRAILLG